jgi:hypothetical protein
LGGADFLLGYGAERLAIRTTILDLIFKNADEQAET